MLLSPSNPFTDTQPMPEFLRLFFYVGGLFLILVQGFRARAFHQEWKRQVPDNLKARFKMSYRQQIELNLYTLGWMVCWTVGFASWWFRAFSAGLALVVIAGLLYRNNLKAPDTPPYDAGSVLDLGKAQGEN